MLNFVFWIIELECWIHESEYTKAQLECIHLSVFSTPVKLWKIQSSARVYDSLHFLYLEFIFITLTKYKMWILQLLCWVLDSVCKNIMHTFAIWTIIVNSIHYIFARLFFSKILNHLLRGKHWHWEILNANSKTLVITLLIWRVSKINC